MKSKWKIILVVLALALAMLACETVMSADPTQTPLPTQKPLPSPTVETPEMRNGGINPYRVVATDQGCPLSVSSEYQDRRIEFEGNQVRIWNYGYEGFETYDQVSPHRYLRYNTVNNPIVVTFTMEGYILEVFTEGDDIDAVQPCGYFTFTLQN
jgi:hypothetical protein